MSRNAAASGHPAPSSSDGKAARQRSWPDAASLVRRAGPWLIPLIAGIASRLVFVQETNRHVPRVFEDTRVFLSIAELPFSLGHLFYPRPLLVPALYRLAEGDPAGIVSLQQEFAFWSWLLLGLALFATLTRWPARLAGLGLSLMMLLAPVRMGWTSAILSESLNDSMMVLSIAVLVLLVGVLSRWRGAAQQYGALVLVGALATAMLAWLLARDTNAITLLAAVPIAWALAVHRRREWLWPASIVATGIVVLGLVTMWTAQVQPANPTGVALADTWSPEMRARAHYPMANNIFVRVLPDPEARSYFVQRGMPMADALAPLREPPWVPEWNWDQRMLWEAEWYPFRQWLVEDGAWTYLGWLSRHPFDRASELAGDAGRIANPGLIDFYMPTGWSRWAWSPTENTAVLVLLAFAGSVALWRPGRHALASVALCIIVSGLVGVLASYYGDGIEIERHTWGSVQQVILGLSLALVVAVECPPFERASIARRLRRTPGDDA